MDLSLLDYRRRVADSYAGVRATEDPLVAHADWVRQRDELFATHPQSPIQDPTTFDSLPMFVHDPSWRLIGTFIEGPGDPLDVEHSGAGATPFVPLGQVTFTRGNRDHSLQVLWLTGYGGGLFLPFRDATNGDSTYGGGRYLLDTVKGADLGHHGTEVVLDFNFAYHPSCVHSDRWSCPLAPVHNRLDVAVEAGERLAA